MSAQLFHGGLRADRTVSGMPRWCSRCACLPRTSDRRAGLNTTQRPQELFRRAVPARVKLVVAGAIWTKEDAEAQLSRGADAVALGRSAIANHDWPERIQRGAPIHQPPLSVDLLRAEGVSPGFIDSLRGWKNFVET